jgi:hypothetical protein
MLTDRVVVAQHLVAAQHQLAENRPRLRAGTVLRRAGRSRPCGGSPHRAPRPCWAQAVLLAATDEPLRLLGRKTLVVDAELLHQPLDRRELVLGVQDLEALRQVGQFVMRAQEAVAQAVEGADPHATHIDRQHAGQARHHLLGGLVGEGHRQDAARRHLPGLQQPRDAGGQYPGLARASTGQDQGMLGRQQ